jgi:hypothetical protein
MWNKNFIVIRKVEKTHKCIITVYIELKCRCNMLEKKIAMDAQIYMPYTLIVVFHTHDREC